MASSKAERWQRFQQSFTVYPTLDLALDLSRVEFGRGFFTRMEGPMRKAFKEMARLEAGSIANPDENRRVGHYWLRQPSLAPEPKMRKEIEKTIRAIREFAARVHVGEITGARGPFKNVLLIGIGGSALGPQLVSQALGHPLTDRLALYCFDNTDPDGMDKVLAAIITELGRTLCIVISKSGGTRETANGMLEAREAYQRAGLSFEAHAVAITQAGSALDELASKPKWLARFCIWDWVGGRTSETSAVGLLPAALQGLDIDALLAGARACDEVTRVPDVSRNPAARLALAWHRLTGGRGKKDMVVLPYKDRLESFARYLQQLVMESLGKEKDRRGRIVHQGLTVYGNKGSTDQHAYVQQLRDGVPNFFVLFLEVLKDRQGESIEFETGATSGEYLSGFMLGTREALYAQGRQSITLTVREVSAFSMGALIALFERTVGLYASLININAYHQPGVQAGKEAADAVIQLQGQIRKRLASEPGRSFSAVELAGALGAPKLAETVFKVCEHLAANPGRGVRKASGTMPDGSRYTWAEP